MEGVEPRSGGLEQHLRRPRDRPPNTCHRWRRAPTAEGGAYRVASKRLAQIGDTSGAGTLLLGTATYNGSFGGGGAAGADAAERTKLISISSPLPEYGASINQPWAQDHAALARADSLPS